VWRCCLSLLVARVLTRCGGLPAQEPSGRKSRAGRPADDPLPGLGALVPRPPPSHADRRRGDLRGLGCPGASSEDRPHAARRQGLQQHQRRAAAGQQPDCHPGHGGNGAPGHRRHPGYRARDDHGRGRPGPRWRPDPGRRSAQGHHDPGAGASRHAAGPDGHREPGAPRPGRRARARFSLAWADRGKRCP